MSFFSRVGIVAFAAVSLWWCGAACSETGKAHETITIWSTVSSSTIDAVLEDFAKSTNTVATSSNYDIADLRLAANGAFALPDMYIIPVDLVAETELFKLGRWNPKDLEEFHVDNDAEVNGDIWGIPILRGNHLVQYYDKRRSVPVAAVEGEGDKKLIWPYDIPFWYISFLNSQDGFPIVGGDIRLDTEQNIKVLDAYRKLTSEEYGFNRNFSNVEWALINGEATNIIDGDWAYEQLHDELGPNLGVAPLPTFMGKPLKSMRFATVIAFRRDITPKKFKLVREIAKRLTADDVQLSLFQSTGRFPAVRDVIRASQIRDDNLRIIYAQLADTVPISGNPLLNKVWAGLDAGLEKALNDKGITTEYAVKIMQSTASEAVLK